MDELRTCSKCGAQKPASAFNRDKYKASGYTSQCKECRKSLDAARWADGRARPKRLVEPVEVGEKTCTDCGQEKSVLDFYVQRSTPDGRTYRCKACKDAENRALAPRYDGWRHEYGRRYNFKRAYGISLDDYEAMLAEQNGVCAICRQPETRIEKKSARICSLSVDHCHATGKVRGLLCFRCNSTLGKVDDDTALLLRMVSYLRR